MKIKPTRRPTRLATLLICTSVAALSACQLVGEGPVALSQFSANGFEDYGAIFGDKAFALTTDGRSYGYAYCTDIRCSGNEVTVAIENCDRGRKRQGLNNTECKVFARDDQIVWQGDVVMPN